jgi:hypothetical protein
MLGDVIEERHAVGLFESWLARAHRVFETAPGGEYAMEHLRGCSVGPVSITAQCLGERGVIELAFPRLGEQTVTRKQSHEPVKRGLENADRLS